MPLPDFKILSSASISHECIIHNIHTFHTAIDFVHHLPYARNTKRNEPTILLTDRCGTCSTKHAFLKRLADENEVPGLHLIVGIFKMKAANTPQVKSILDRYSLDYLPEAHTYLKYYGQIYDYTKSPSFDFEDDLIEEVEIAPEEITEYKIIYHRTYIEEWLSANKQIPYSLSELWAIREECIKALSN